MRKPVEIPNLHFLVNVIFMLAVCATRGVHDPDRAKALGDSTDVDLGHARCCNDRSMVQTVQKPEEIS